MNSLPGPLRAIGTFATTQPALAAVVGLLALALAIAASRAAWKALRGALKPCKFEDLLTVLAASVATAVAMTGMWRVFGNALGFSGLLRVLLFTFLELSTVTSAVRARRNIRESARRVAEGSAEKVTAGADGAAVWVFTSISAVVASLDAGNLLGSMVRFAAPFVAAWLWERSLAAVRREVLGGTAVHSRLTIERVLVWLRIAEPSGRTVSEVDAHRRIARLARAANHSRELAETDAAGWRQRRASRRRRALLMAALEHTKLATDEATWQLLRQHLGGLAGAAALSAMDAPAPWDMAQQHSAAAPPMSATVPAGSALVVPADGSAPVVPVPPRGSTVPVPADGSGSTVVPPRRGSGSGSASGSGSRTALSSGAPPARAASGSRRLREVEDLLREARAAETAAGRRLGVKALRAALACNYQTARSVAQQLHPETASDDGEAVGE